MLGEQLELATSEGTVHPREQRQVGRVLCSWSLLKLMSVELVMPSSHLILCHPLLLTPLIFSSIRVFSNESVLGGQSMGTSPSASVLPINIQDWFPLGLTSLISVQYLRACPYRFSLQWSVDSLRLCILCSFVVLAEPTQVCWHRDMASSHTSDANPSYNLHYL